MMWLTDGQTDGRHTIIRPKFHFWAYKNEGLVQNYCNFLSNKASYNSFAPSPCYALLHDNDYIKECTYIAVIGLTLRKAARSPWLKSFSRTSHSQLITLWLLW